MNYSIALGTTSEHKHTFFSEVLKELGIDAHVECFAVHSRISDQPLTEIETRLGSINRAHTALEKKSDADFGMGIEIGYHKADHGEYEMIGSAAIFDQQKDMFQAYSSRLLLPEFHQNILLQGGYLADFVRDYKKNSTSSLDTYTRDMIIYRVPFIKESVRNVLVAYISRR